jgi:hypothetical protein
MKRIFLDYLLPCSFPFIAIACVWALANYRARLEILAPAFFICAFLTFFIWHGFRMRLFLGALDALIGHVVFYVSNRVQDAGLWLALIVMAGILFCAALVSLVAVLMS